MSETRGVVPRQPTLTPRHEHDRVRWARPTAVLVRWCVTYGRCHRARDELLVRERLAYRLGL